MAEPLLIDRPQRWDRPFGPGMSEADIDRVLGLELFRDIDPEQFPASLSLRDIIRNDSRIVRCRPGDIVVRDGDYGNSVFVILEGRVRVVLDEVGQGRLDRFRSSRKRSFLDALSQLWRNASMPEVRDVARYQESAAVSLRGESADARTFIRDIDAFLAAHATEAMDEGQTFGEIAALSRSPRTATVFAETDLELVELRWQGLREIRRRDKMLREHIDGLYRHRRLRTQLHESPLFGRLDEAALNRIAERTLFETHGEFEWFASYKRVASKDPTEVLKHEPIIAEEGSYVDGLLLVCSGFARVSRRLDRGEKTVGILGANDVFGLEEIVRHARDGTPLLHDHSLRAIGYVDVLRIPTALIERYVLPELLEAAAPAGGRAAARESDREPALEQALFDFFVDNRTINGTATMLINLDRCTGCDDCVRACASTHDNNPRFIRHGRVHDSFQIAQACMHCVDPVCLIGCPTGAIARNYVDGRVMIDDRICIGCGTCAQSCPYDNIQLVEIRDRDGSFILDSKTGTPIVKAAKCDLCHGQLGGPACQRACPHDALARMDMLDQVRLAEWIGR